ncbi:MULTISPECIES: hypothetical protein [unclassified Streptomyces]|uniref:hypothetical protein n=1 Tax=unclassified Streptomyces TaxID=2593676 RepID=UPI0033984032
MEDTLLKVGETDSGAALISIIKGRGSKVYIDLDCLRRARLGNGDKCIVGDLPPELARSVLLEAVRETPWLQEALATAMIDHLLSEGTGDDVPPKRPTKKAASR